MSVPDKKTKAESDFPNAEQTQIDAFGVIADETDGFDNWWAEDGSGIPVCPWHDCEEHAHKVALFAYRAGMEQGRSDA